jgi:hypothetical protein
MKGEMKDYILVFAPPGVGLTKAAEKLAKAMHAEIYDIEEEIKKDPKTEQALNEVKATCTRDFDMETVTHNLPRSKVSELWKESVASCLKTLEQSSKPVRILCGHLTYYSSKRNEFYSVIDYKYFYRKIRDQITLKPKCILLLIDDVYDMYKRLSKLYSPDQIESFFRKIEKDRDVDVKGLTKDRLASLTFAWEIRNLLHLLFWRHIESIMAENLALQLEDAKFLVWPVKQILKAIKLWLNNSQAKAIYLSHPISEPRREKKAAKKWPKFTSEINKLQKMMASKEIALVMPTGIDELRFDVKKQKYTGYLKDRWPLITEKKDKLLYFKPSKDTDINYCSLLRPKYWDFQKQKLSLFRYKECTDTLKSEINAFLQVLVREIEVQISSRDFLYIYHTDGLLVYRPYYANVKKPRATFSGGVDAEVRLWEDIVQLGKLGKEKFIAFVHFKRDLKSMLQAKKDDIPQEFVDTVWRLLSKVYNVDRNIVENMVKNKGRVYEIENILNKANIAQGDKEELKKTFREYWERSKIELFKKYLTNAIDVEEKLIGVWIVDSFDSLKKETTNIANFLRRGEPRGNNAEKQIKTLFSDAFISV